MTFNLDDLWLDKMERWPSLSLSQKRRLYRILIVLAIGASYLLDTLLLSLFAFAGTISYPVVLFYAGAGLGHILIFSILHWTGFSERFSNPHMTIWQMSYALLAQLIGIFIAPQISALFMGISIIIFSFGAMRIAIREMLVFLGSASLIFIVTITLLLRQNTGLSHPSRIELFIISFAFATVLLRCVSLAYFGTALRMRMYERTHMLEKAATYDALTGIHNRSHIMEIIDKNIDLFKRKSIISSIVMIDIDNFKSINDTYGHLFGDTVIKQVTETIDQSIRGTDYLGRYGGDELILLLPATDAEHAVPLIDRARMSVEGIKWNEISGDFATTISCGVTEIHHDDTLETLLARADSALYKAKNAGRNQVYRLE